jgi:hypothetical protein
MEKNNGESVKQMATTQDAFTQDAFTQDAFTQDAFTQDAFTQDAYLTWLSGHDMQKQAYAIAKEHLGTSFDLLKSNGFQEFCKKTG